MRLHVNGKDIEKQKIYIGFEGEKNYTEIEFDFSDVFSEYPEASSYMNIKPYKGEIYPHTLTREGTNLLVWNVNEADCTVPGVGMYQITFTYNNTVIKSFKGICVVRDSIIGSADPPTPVEEWITDASAALAALENITASAENLPEGSEATAEIRTVNGHKDIHIGVPAGEKGDQGFSPVVTVTDVPGGHQVVIEDESGEHTFTVMNGEDGDDGVSPQVTVTNITGGHRVSITDASGTDTFDVMDGQDGQDGVTPDFSIGTVQTLPAGSDATASVTGTTANPVLNLGIPQGAKGDPGEIPQETLDQIESDISDLKSALNDSGVVQTVLNIPLTVGGYINKSGNIAANNDFSYSDFISSDNIHSVYACMGYNVAVLAYYNAQRQFIGYLNTTSDAYVSQWWDLTAPAGTKFIRFSNRKNLPNADVKIKKIINVGALSDSTEAASNKLSHINNDIIPNDVELSANAGIVNYVGQLINTEYHSDPITLKQGETIYFTCRSSDVIAPISRLVTGYNRYAVLVVGVNENDHTYSYTAFEDMQVVLSWYGSHPYYATINRVYSIVNMDKKLRDIENVDYSACVSRILCIGDSLTAGALFLNSPTNYVGDNAKSYPYFLSKEMNIQCVNKGSDGATPELWFSRLYTETVFDDYDCLLLWLGTNHGLSDTLETDVDPYDDYHNYTGNTGKYCRIIEEFKAKTNNAPVFLIKVFDGGYDTETGITKEITNSVIDKIAQKYNVPTIETAEFLYQTPPEGYSDLAVKIHGVNELHFNTYGNMYIAHHFHEAMKAYWKNNTDKMDVAYRLMGNGLPWWMEH